MECTWQYLQEGIELSHLLLGLVWNNSSYDFITCSSFCLFGFSLSLGKILRCSEWKGERNFNSGASWWSVTETLKCKLCNKVNHKQSTVGTVQTADKTIYPDEDFPFW